MCGIAGWVGVGQPIDDVGPSAIARVQAMLEALRHRGPDDEGVDVVADFPGSLVVLGHRRLSILDLSSAGHQPMHSSSGRFTITFNGEIYNYLELRSELASRYEFRSESDTEVLLAAYEAWGPSMLHRLDGMFAFAIADRSQRELFAARDPIGIKPFYYATKAGEFVFASEPQAILGALSGRPTLDAAHASEFLLFGLSDHDDGTFFQDVCQLKGGHSLTVDMRTARVESRVYWRPPEVWDIAPPRLFAKYRDVAREAVGRQLRSDVPVGSSLSGGIDSSTIVTLAGELLGPKAADYSTLTFTFPDFENDESALAEAVARRSGLRWHRVQPELETLGADLERMVASMVEPFSSLSMFAQYKVMERASELGLKVMLDGQGGDEVYLGYSRVAQGVPLEHLGAGRLHRFYREWTALRRNQSIDVTTWLLGNVYFRSKSLVLRRGLKRMSRYVRKEFLAQYRPEIPEDRYAPKNVAARQLDELCQYCLPRLLRYADRNSMAFGVEQRVPHLSTLILNFALSIPTTRRVVDGWPKHYVRESMRGRIPDEVLWSVVKRGFDIPQGFWVSHLLPVLHDSVDALPTPSPFRVDVIRADLSNEQRQDSLQLWAVLSLIASIVHTGARIA